MFRLRQGRQLVIRSDRFRKLVLKLAEEARPRSSVPTSDVQDIIGNRAVSHIGRYCVCASWPTLKALSAIHFSLTKPRITEFVF